MNRYTHGHEPAVVAAHAARTAANSAPRLVPLLQPGWSVLDVGCGPGSVTIDLARRVAPGRVVGVDRSAEVIEAARRSAEAAGVEVGWWVGDIATLPFDDACFEVVHAHQVLQHLADPVAALAEMSRVCRPGGWIAVRDADYGAMTWYPDRAELSDWRDLYRSIARANGAEPDAGRRLHQWARAAGLTDVDAGATAWSFSSPAERRWWAEQWVARLQTTSFVEQAVVAGRASAARLAELAGGWRWWADQPDGWFLVPHGDLLARPAPR